MYNNDTARFSRAARALMSGQCSLAEAKRMAGYRQPTLAERRETYNAMADGLYAQRKKAREQYRRMFGVVLPDDDDDGDENISQPPAKPEDVYALRRQHRMQRQLS